MELREAYQQVMDFVFDLKNSGISVKIEQSAARNDKEILDRFDGRSDRLPSSLWCHVAFNPRNQQEAQTIHDISKELNRNGITFDIGGMANRRNWEIDWSFRLTGKGDKQRIESMEAVEALIREHCESEST